MKADEAARQDIGQLGEAFGGGHVVGMKRGHHRSQFVFECGQCSDGIAAGIVLAVPSVRVWVCAGLCGGFFAHLR